MHLAVLLTFGIVVCGPALIDGSERRIVFVVPRYVRRSSYDTTQQFFEHREPAYKTRRSPRRPYSNNQNSNSEQFYLPEKHHHHRVPQGGDDFDQSIFTPHQQVRHVLIPHGKGITHGISFGKGYIPHEEFKGMSEEYNFPAPESNHLDFGDLQTGHRGSGQFRFEDNEYGSQFNQNHERGVQPGSGTEWPSFVHHRQEGNYEQEEEPRHQDHEMQTSASFPSNEEIFFPKYSQIQQQDNGEEKRSVSVAVNPSHPVMQEHKPAPLIFQDSVDMKEYIEKIQAFARSWPHAAHIQTFGWQNQIPNPQIQNYNQGFNSWAGYLQPHQNSGGGYQVQEESTEESNRRHFRQLMR